MSHPSAYNPGPGQLQLVVHAGPLAGKGFPITGNALSFGRGTENDIVLDDTQVSRNHARLIRQDDEVVIEDLGSTNGTLVNGKPVVGQQVLQPADIISIGSSVFGVKGFAAPTTIGVTQISMDKRTYPPPLTSSPPAPPRVSSPPSPRPISPPPAESSGFNMLVVGGIIALILVVVTIAGVTAYFLTQDRGSTVTGIPTVVITAPTANSQVQINVPVTVQATASDPAGVKRMELWVTNIKTADAISPVEQGQPTLTASFQWTPPAPGTYTLEVKAFNSQGQVSAPTTVMVSAVGENAGAETPTPGLPTETPTATVPAKPSLTTKTDLNVRAGPGIEYDLLGLLPAGVTVEIIGREETRQWWQIRFSPAADGIGWVAADPAFSTTANVDNVAVAQVPPTPTGTPTSTATVVPPTNTPTITTLPPTLTPTGTPTFTPTPTGQPTTIDFNISPTNIEGGECVNVTWNTSGVREVYFEDQGVGGSANMTECPKESKTYDFRVIRLDGSEYREEIRVEVNNPIVSADSVEISDGDSIDVDDGSDDFEWEVDDEERYFRARGGVQLAPIRDLSDLRNLSKSDCENATFGVYSFIDGSDNPADQANRLLDGGSICYRTNEGRLGKLWFPNGIDDDLDVEWVTWQ